MSSKGVRNSRRDKDKAKDKDKVADESYISVKGTKRTRKDKDKYADDSIMSQSTSSISKSMEEDIKKKYQMNLHLLREKMKSEIDRTENFVTKEIKRIELQIAELPAIYLCQAFTNELFQEKHSDKPGTSGDPTSCCQSNMKPSRSRKVNFGSRGNSSSSHHYTREMSNLKTPRSAHRMLKTLSTPAAETSKKTKVNILRVPESGETCMSAAGSPLLVAMDPAHSVPQLRIPISNGKVMHVIPGDGDESFNDDLMTQLAKVPSTQNQLKKMKNILSKLIVDDEVSSAQV